jgi:hypothetical protein
LTRTSPRHRRQLTRRREGPAEDRLLTKHPRELAEHRVRLSRAGSQRARGHQRLTLVELELRAERLADAPVALTAERFDPALGDHPVGFPVPRQPRDELHALALHDQEARTSLHQRGLESAERVEHELHAVRKLASPGGREEVWVEHEQRNDLARGDRIEQGCVV